jgi:cytochrome c5
MKNTIAIALAAGLAVSCKPAPEPEPVSKFSLTQLAAKRAADLGADFVNVSDYPEAQQKNYRVFSLVCAQCHTLARPINSRIVKRADWDRIMRRMHGKTVVYGWWTDFAKTDAKKILDFLEYDGKRRKIDDKAAFEKYVGELEALFLEVQAEQKRYKEAMDRRAAATRGTANQ